MLLKYTYYSLVLKAGFEGSIFKAQPHLHKAGGQVEQGHECVPRVGGGVQLQLQLTKKNLGCTDPEIQFYLF